MRKSRHIVPGAGYHVVARANRQEFIFKSKRVKELFLSVTERAKKKFRFSLSSFCIMSNHIHFLIFPMEGESLSRIMQWILSVFAAKYNRIFGLKGHVWYDRFKSSVVHTMRYFAAAFKYIAANPVKASIVEHPSDYPFGGLYHIRNGDWRVVTPPREIAKLLDT
jgi:putative transposase